MRHECKITVLETRCFPEFQGQYLADPKSGPCPFFKLGDTFLLTKIMQTVWDYPVIMIETIYVVESSRRNGICRMLMDCIKKEDNPVIWLNMQPVNNESLG